jgi:cyclase
VRTRFVAVAPDVYAVLGSNGMPNAVCVDGGADGVVIIDSRFSPTYAEEMLAALREVTDAPVVALLNTHFHCDHTFGNPAIPTDRIIAHERARAKLEAMGDAYVEELRGRRPDLRDELEGVTLRLPTETIGDGGMTLPLGDMTLRINYAGVPAHTDHDLWVLIPERRVLVAADLAFNTHEVTPFMHGGDLYGVRDAVSRLPRDGVDVVIPGHGEVGGLELLDQQLEFVDTLTAIGEEVVADGGDLDDARRLAFERYGTLLFAADRLPESVEQAYDRAVKVAA